MIWEFFTHRQSRRQDLFALFGWADTNVGRLARPGARV
jgi:hypothetical protein